MNPRFGGGPLTIGAISVVLLVLVVQFVSPKPLAYGQTPPARSLAEMGRIRMAYYFPPDAASLESLRENQGRLDVVAPHWLTIDGAGVVTAAERPEAVAVLRAGRALVLPSVMVTDAAAAHRLLSEAGLREVTIENLLRAVAPWDGLALDFEGLDASDRENLSVFINALGLALRAAGKLHLIALPAKSTDLTTGWSGAYDYPAITGAADLFLVMAYGWRTSGSREPGSTAPMWWVDACMQYAARTLAPERLLLGVPFYGYDWNVDRGPPARALRFGDTQRLVSRLGIEPTFDPVIGSSTFTYRENGENHEVWYDDARALRAKLDLVARYQLRGAGAWRLGQEDPSAWGPWDVALGGLPRGGPTPTTLVGQSPTATLVSPVAPTPEGGRTAGTAPSGLTEGAVATLWAGAGDVVTLRLTSAASSPATVTATFVYDNGMRARVDRTVGVGERLAVELSSGVGADAAFTFGSTVPVAVDVVTRRSDGASSFVTGGAPGSRWVFPDVPVGGETTLVIFNPGARAATGTMRARAASGGLLREQTYALEPGKRLRVTLPPAGTEAYWTEVAADAPVVVARQTRLPGAVVTDVGGPAETRWLMLASPVGENWASQLVFANPNGVAVSIRTRWTSENGEPDERLVSIPPNGRATMEVPTAAGRAAVDIVADHPVSVVRTLSERNGIGVAAQAGVPHR